MLAKVRYNIEDVDIFSVLCYNIDMDESLEFSAIKKDLIMIVAVIILFGVILAGLEFLQVNNQFVTKSATKISSVLLK